MKVHHVHLGLVAWCASVLVLACGSGGPDPVHAGGGAAHAGSGGAAGALGGHGGTGGNSNGAAGSGGSGDSAGSGGGGSGGGDGTGGASAGATGGASGPGPQKVLEAVLVFSLVDVNPKTGMLRGHTGSGADEELLQDLGSEHGFEVVLAEDGSVFTPENLAGFDVVVFASPHYTTQVLQAEQRDALEAFVRQGGGWVGWHYALKVEKDWPFMQVLGGGVTIGAHAKVEPSVYVVEDAAHPLMNGVPASFEVTDDHLAISGDLRSNDAVSVLATAELGADPGADHPTVWAHEVDQGRVFYSMPGHGGAPFRTAWYRTLLWNALRWAARAP